MLNKTAACIIILLSTLILINCSNTFNPSKKIFISNGIINISDYNFEKKGIVTLSGMWEFYWKQLLQPIDFKKAPIKYQEFITVPNYFNKKLSEKNYISKYGYATFRLLINIKNNKSNLALYLPWQGTATTYFINGKKIFTAGTIGKNKTETIPEYKNGTYQIPLHTTKIEIIVHISNFHHFIGGFTHSLKLGTTKQILKKRERNIIFEFLLFGSIIIISFYHFSIFLFRKKEKTSLYFSLLCFLIAFRILVQGELFLSQIVAGISWELITKIEYLTFYLGIPMFAFYIHTLYKQETSKIITKILIGIASISFLLISFTPANIFTQTLHFYQIVTLLFCIYAAISLGLATIRKRPGSEIFFAGALIFGITVTNDILHSRKIIDTSYFVPLGLFFFILSQAVLLSKRLSTNITTIEILKDNLTEINKDLNVLNESLEIKVEERTIELKEAFSKIQTVNDSLEKTNRDLEIAQKNIMDDMLLAQKVQQGTLIIQPPKCKNYEIAFFFEPMTEISGDFYDLYIEDKILQGISLFDISGHGVSSGLITMLAKSIIQRNFISLHNSPLGSIMEKSNDELIKELLYIEKYLTGILLRFKGNTIEYVNAAHPDLIVMRSNNEIQIIEENNLDFRGTFLGFDELKTDYNHITFSIDIGDSIIIFSDGLIECYNEKNKLFEMEGLIDVLKRCSSNLSPKEIIDEIITALYTFSNTESFTDDVTIVIVKKIA